MNRFLIALVAGSFHSFVFAGDKLPAQPRSYHVVVDTSTAEGAELNRFILNSPLTEDEMIALNRKLQREALAEPTVFGRAWEEFSKILDEAHWSPTASKEDLAAAHEKLGILASQDTTLGFSVRQLAALANPKFLWTLNGQVHVRLTPDENSTLRQKIKDFKLENPQFKQSWNSFMQAVAERDRMLIGYLPAETVIAPFKKNLEKAIGSLNHVSRNNFSPRETAALTDSTYTQWLDFDSFEMAKMEAFKKLGSRL